MASEDSFSSENTDTDAWEEDSIHSDEEKDPRPWLPKDPGNFIRGQAEWHPYTSDADRQDITERLAGLIFDLSKNHPRKNELMWFARQCEAKLYNKSCSKMRYIRNAEGRADFISKIMEVDPKFIAITAAGDIPDVHDLESFFHVKSDRMSDPEFHQPGGIRVELLGPENFTHHNFRMTTSDTIQCIPAIRPGEEDEMMDTTMPMAFREIKLDPK